MPEKFDESVFIEFKQAYENFFINPTVYKIDFKKTEEINSTGMLLLLTLFHYAKDRGKNIQLINTKPQVKQFLIENHYNDIINLG